MAAALTAVPVLLAFLPAGTSKDGYHVPSDAKAGQDVAHGDERAGIWPPCPDIDQPGFNERQVPKELVICSALRLQAMGIPSRA